jgi:hypothetical protein
MTSANPSLTNRSRLALKCIKIVRPTLFGYLETREEFDYYGSRLLGYLTSGKLKSRIHKIYPLSEVQQAHIVRTPFCSNLEKSTIKC